MFKNPECRATQILIRYSWTVMFFENVTVLEFIMYRKVIVISDFIRKFAIMLKPV